MTAYERGAAFERRVKADLEKRGYRCIRSAGSHGPVDIVAIGPAHYLLVQAKTDGRCDPAEWNVLWETAESHMCGAPGFHAAVLASIGPRPRQIVYRHLTGPKIAGQRCPPCEVFEP